MEFRDCRGEYRFRCERAEQRHRRAEFKVVRTAEYFPDCSALDSVDQRRALPKPGSQNAVPEVGHGLLARGNRKSPGHRAMAEAGELGKNEPHPVTLLPTMAQFGNNTRVDLRLRIDKALKIERIGHGARLAPGWPIRSASRSRSGRWLCRILACASGRSNHSARSISGKVCILPPFGGHSISKLLLLTV